jgi:hypothetical protein
MKFRHSGRVLEIDGKSYEFGQDILQVLQRGEDRVIVSLNGAQCKPDDPNIGRNVFSLDRRGKELWRIKPSGFTRTLKDGREVPLSWQNIYFEDHGETMRIGDPKGFAYKLDPDTGEVSEPDFRK